MKLFGRTPWTSQPQVNVGVDGGNPLAKSLAFAITPVGFRDAVRNRAVTRNGISVSANQKGLGFKAASNASAAAAFSASKLSSSGASGTGDFTVLVVANPVASATREILYTLGNGANEFYFAVNVTVGLVAQSGTVSPQTNTGGASGVAQTSGADGSFHTWIYTRIGTVGTLYRDGVVVGTNAVSTPVMWSVASADYVGGYSSANWGISKSVNLVCGWNRGLTESEAKSVSLNPWQIFQPLARSVYFGVPAAGYTYTLTADSGSFALTGQTVGLAANRILTADTQSYALTGQTAGLAFNRTLSAASGSFSLAGQDAGLSFNRVLSAESGSYALTGQDATLTYTPVGGPTYTLTADSGSFALTGQDTWLAFNRVLTADTQSYSLTGQAAGLAFNRVLVADTTSFALTGHDATLTYTTNGYTYTLSAESRSFALAGQDVGLSWSGDQTSYSAEVDLTPSKWYIKRNKKILLFNNAQEADAFLEAEEQAEQAVKEAQKTSRRARKRLRDKLVAVEPIQTVDVDQLAQAVERFSIPVDLPKLLAQMDYDKVMKTIAIAADLADEEDIEMLLLM